MKRIKRFVKSHYKTIIFCAIVVLLIILNRIFGWSEYLSDSKNLSFLSEMIENNMLAAGLIYIGITIIACTVLALPGVVFAILAGAIFGPWWGTLFCLVATTIGAITSFIIGRFFLQDSIKPMVEKSPKIKKLLFDDVSRSDIILLAITRLVPLFPYNIQNFAYGITDMSLSHYSLYTFFFMIPGVALYTFGAAGLTSDGNKFLYFGIAAALLVITLSLAWFIKKKYLGEENLQIDENAVFVESMQGQDLGEKICNIIKELLTNPDYENFNIYISAKSEVARGKALKLISSCNAINGKAQIITTYSTSYNKCLATARYLFTDNIFTNSYIKQKGQIYTNISHIAIKVEDEGNPKKLGAFGDVQKNYFDADYIVFNDKFDYDKDNKKYMLRNLCHATVLISENAEKLLERIIQGKDVITTECTVADNGNPNVLVHVGSLSKKSKINFLVEFMSNADVDENNYVITLQRPYLRDAKEALQDRAREVNFVVQTGKIPLTVMQKVVLKLYKHRLVSYNKYFAVLRPAFEKDIRRQFSENVFEEAYFLGDDKQYDKMREEVKCLKFQ